MTFRRPPAPPSRALEIISIGFAVLVVIGMSAYLVHAVFRGLITWSDVPIFQAAVLVSCLPIIAINYGLRRRRLKKAVELREYERTLATLAERT